jgi:hypothetical protein
MNAKEDNGHYHQSIQKVHNVHKSSVNYATDSGRICYRENATEIVIMDCLHGKVESKEHQRRSKIDQEVTEIKVENLHFEEEIGNGHLGTCSQTHLLLHLIEGKH